MSAYQQGAALGSAPMVEVVGAKDPSGNAVPLAAGADGALLLDTELPAAAQLADGASSTPTTVTLAAILEAVQTGDSTKVDRLLQDLKRLAVSVYGKGAAAGDTALLLSDLNAAAFSSGSSVPGPVVAQSLLWGHDGSSAWGRLRQGALSADAQSGPGAGVLWGQMALRLLNPSGTLDRAGSAAASGAGLGALKVHSQNESNLTLLSSAARTSTGQGTAVTGLGAYKSATFFLDVTAAATDAADTLDVYVEYSPDGGTVWDALAHFTQVLGNGGAKQFVTHVNVAATPAAEHAVGAALAAGQVRHIDFGDRLRVRWDITDGGGGGNVSFTLAVKGSFKG